MLKLAIASRSLSGARTASVTTNSMLHCISTSVNSQGTGQVLPLTNQIQEKNWNRFGSSLQQTFHAGDLEEVNRSLRRLSLSPLELKASLELVLPSKDHHQLPNAIVEPIPKPAFDCPHSGIVRHVFDPTVGIDRNFMVPGIERLKKKAKNRITNDIHRRRRKMNHHQYKKWRKKMKFKLRHIKQKRRKRKQKRWEQYLEGVKFKGISQEEGEAYLKAREERLKIFLRYLGFEGDAVKTDRPVKLRGTQYVKRVRKITRRMDDSKSGMIVPTPILKRN